MFTGIVEDIGTVKRIDTKEKEIVFTFEVNKIDLDNSEIGDSIAVNGACLTVISLNRKAFSVEASHETLIKTNLNNLKVGSKVNLERSLKVGAKLGGHIVNGHVDGVGRVESTEKQGDSVEFTFSVSDEVLRYIVEKGSVSIDGVSLTVNSVRGNEFAVNVIPYTRKETIFGELAQGSLVNVECDIIGKYVEKFIVGTAKKQYL